jgi:hypothetical protein
VGPWEEGAKATGSKRKERDPNAEPLAPCPDWEAKNGPSTSHPPEEEEEASWRH